MNDLMCKIGNDSTYALTAAIALVVVLFIVLLVIITSMRVKTYKDRFINTRVDNKEKEMQIADLQSELQEKKKKNAQNEQELHLFAQTKEKLAATESVLDALQKTTNEVEKLQSQTQSKLEYAQEKHENLLEEHKALQAHFGTIQEENSKLHINNARLLMKLETEARFSSQLNLRNNKENGRDRSS